MENENFLPVQDERVLELIRDSLLRCRASGVPEFVQALPEVSQEAKKSAGNMYPDIPYS